MDLVDVRLLDTELAQELTHMKQLSNRVRVMSVHRKFIVGVSYSWPWVGIYAGIWLFTVRLGRYK